MKSLPAVASVVENGEYSPVTSKVMVTGEVVTICVESTVAADSSELRAAGDQNWAPVP